jgi:hypothetical protein
MQPITGKVVVEGVLVGIFLIIIVYVISAVLARTNLKPMLPEICGTWNKNHIMEINLFLSGFLFHIGCEVSGLNLWYAKNKIAAI